GLVGEPSLREQLARERQRNLLHVGAAAGPRFQRRVGVVARDGAGGWRLHGAPVGKIVAGRERLKLVLLVHLLPVDARHHAFAAAQQQEEQPHGSSCTLSAPNAARSRAVSWVASSTLSQKRSRLARSNPSSLKSGWV